MSELSGETSDSVENKAWLYEFGGEPHVSSWCDFLQQCPAERADGWVHLGGGDGRQEGKALRELPRMTSNSCLVQSTLEKEGWNKEVTGLGKSKR